MDSHSSSSASAAAARNDDTLGEQFARALAAKEFGRIEQMLATDVEFRALTPRRAWEADGPAAVIEILGTWFSESDRIEALEMVERDEFADRERVGYRFAVESEGRPFVVEQQAYLTASQGRISWMRVLCSGYREVEPSQR